MVVVWWFYDALGPIGPPTLFLPSFVFHLLVTKWVCVCVKYSTTLNKLFGIKSVEFGSLPATICTPGNSDTSPASPYDSAGGKAPWKGSQL